MSLERKEIFEFGDFRLDVNERTIERLDRQPCRGKLTEKAFQTLALLLRRRGHLVGKDELLAAIWPDSVVEENNLDKQIHHLRRFLDEKNRGRYIETIPKRGYRFVEKVRVVEVSGSWIPDSYRTRDRSNVSELVSTSDLAPANARSVDEEPRPQPDDALSATKAEPVPTASSHALRKWWVPATVLLLVVASASSIWMLSKPAAKVPILDRRFSSDPLSTNGNVFAPAISPNGRHVVYISRHSNGQQSVWIRDLDTGSNVEIVTATWDTYRAVAFSPDNSQVYFVRSPRSDQEGDLYRTAIFGGTPRKIVSGTDGHFSISPDGASISFVRCPLTADEYCSLWLASSADGKDERRLLARRAPFRIASNRFSPDGRNIAFAAGQSRNLANDFGLFSISTAGGQEKPLTDERFFNIKGLVWLPTGQDLLIAASRIPNKTFRIWQVSAVDGNVAGLTSDTQSYSDLSIDDSAMRLVAAVVNDDFAITVASRATGQALGTIDDGLQPTFGPSGKVYFRSARSGNDEIWCANTDGSQLLQLTTEPSTDQSPIASSGHVYFNSNRSGAMHVWRMAPDGTDPEQFTTNNGGIPFAISADNKWLYYHHAIDRTVWRIATDSRTEEKVLDKQVRVFAVSQSARFIAFDETLNGTKSVVIIELGSTMDGGPPRVFELPDQDSRLIDAAWLPDEEALLMALEGAPYQDRLLQLRIIDGHIDAITLPAKMPIEHVDISPDDQLLAIAQGQWLHDAVLIHGLR